MKIQGFNDNTWLYPDSVITNPDSFPALAIARGGHTALQILGDVEIKKGTHVSVTVDGVLGLKVMLYQLCTTHVEANSGLSVYTAKSYDEVEAFVTRQAPFDVYDVTIPIGEAAVCDGRLALFLRFEATTEAETGDHEIVVKLEIDGQVYRIRLSLFVSGAIVPTLDKAKFGVVNWLSYENVKQAHKVEPDSEEFWLLVEAYMTNQLELRSGHLKLPAGVPIKDKDGMVTDFDFSFCEKVAKYAISMGFPYVYGDFVVRWKVWNEPELDLKWDKSIDATSCEGYRQLKLYFTKLWKLVEDNNWKEHWMQCLVDEPQFQNSLNYRAVSGICRKCMPGVLIHDPVEATELCGATDIWCVKQQTYDKYKKEFSKLQNFGEKLWVYTCGFPAGKWMNRATDLPLLAGRLIFWLAVRCNMEGFLHWGYNVYSERNPFLYNCCYRGESKPLPPGNGFIVYPGPTGPWNSVRSQVQLMGAEDAEILMQLEQEKMQALCDRVCTDFEHYESDEALFAQVREEMLRLF